jgi:hypothetical protein
VLSISLLCRRADVVLPFTIWPAGAGDVFGFPEAVTGTYGSGDAPMRAAEHHLLPHFRARRKIVRYFGRVPERKSGVARVPQNNVASKRSSGERAPPMPARVQRPAPIISVSTIRPNISKGRLLSILHPPIVGRRVAVPQRFTEVEDNGDVRLGLTLLHPFYDVLTNVHRRITVGRDFALAE